jgi:arylsulfatase A-like enzyme/Flp pilus assembly protein TadD
MPAIKRPFFYAILAALTLVLAGAGFFLFHGRQQPGPCPNILFIVVDTLRADHVGCYGYNKIKTPNIDSLAELGTRFDRVVAQVPLTLPSHASFMTSTWPEYNNVKDNGDKLSGSAVTLAEVLRDNGYVTGAFVSTFVLAHRFGIGQGFDAYDDDVERVTPGHVIRLMNEERTADKVSARAVSWLENNKDKRFFLWVHFYDPHAPYVPPSPYKEMYSKAPYDGEIAFTDENIGRILAALRDLGLDRNTLVVLTGDHGEGLGDHGEEGHGLLLYDSTLKVPLIFSYPGVLPERTVRTQVRLIDIMPTILDIAGVRKNGEIQGKSLLAMIKGPRPSKDIPAYSESVYARKYFNRNEFRSFNNGEWKFIGAIEPELYDMRTDSRELINVYSREKKKADGLEKELGTLLGKISGKTKPAVPAEKDKETMEKLRSLGYLQGDNGKKKKDGSAMQLAGILEQMNAAAGMANRGTVEEAIRIYQRQLAADPENIEAMRRLGSCYKESGRYDKAVVYFTKAAYVTPEDAGAHADLAGMLRSMGRLNEAMKEIKIAVKLDPENPEMVHDMGWVYQQMGKVDEAVIQYRKALDMDDSLPSAHTNLGMCYRIKGDVDGAVKEFEKALSLDHRFATAFSEMGVCMAIKGDLEKAVEYGRKAVEYGPDEPDGYNNLGVTYEGKGDLYKALETFLDGVKIAPRDARMLCNAAEVYFRLGNEEKGKEFYRKALLVDPRYVSARKRTSEAK